MFKDFAGVTSDLCHKCDGKGYQWKTGLILNRVTGEEIATTYARGDYCPHCRGSGQMRAINMRRALIWAIVLLPVVLIALRLH